MIDQQVVNAVRALSLAESLKLVPAESEQPLPDHVADLVNGMHPAYHDTLIASLHPHRAVLTDDLGFRVIAQEAGAAFTWTQALIQAAHGLKSISHPEYRNVVAALIDANYRFIQFGPAEILGELNETEWTVNERLHRYAGLMTNDTIDRTSIARLLSQVLVDSILQAPNDRAFAAFHVAYERVARDAGMFELMRSDYEAALKATYEVITWTANRKLLPNRLLSSTYMTSPMELTRESRRLATRQVERIWDALQEGGLSLEAL